MNCSIALFNFIFIEICFILSYEWIQCVATVHLNQLQALYQHGEEHGGNCHVYCLCVFLYGSDNTLLPWLLMDVLQINLDIHHIPEYMDDSHLKCFSAISTFKLCGNSVSLTPNWLTKPGPSDANIAPSTYFTLQQMLVKWTVEHGLLFLMFELPVM